MTIFLRLLEEKDKANSLVECCTDLRLNKPNTKLFYVESKSFLTVPGAPFAYWVNQSLRDTFGKNLPELESEGRDVQSGATSGDDNRFLRLFWEIQVEELAVSRIETSHNRSWVTIPKGGSFSAFYSDWPLVVNWKNDGFQIKEFVSEYRGKKGWGYNWTAALNGHSQYFRPGVTWPRRTTSGLSMRAMPSGCIFADKGPAIFVPHDDPQELLAIQAIVSSKPFSQLVGLKLAAADAAARSYEVGIIESTPIPNLSKSIKQELASFSLRAWSLKRTLDTVVEVSHAFVLPDALRTRLGDYEPLTIEAEILCIQSEIDDIVFDLYGLGEADRVVIQNDQILTSNFSEANIDDGEIDDSVPIDQTTSLLSWAIGVVFGRFDWRLATGERTAPPEPEPFDPLLATSPGMLPHGAEPFHHHSGILVDDSGHPHDLPHLIEEVLNRVRVPVPDNVRRWLQKDFFTFHLKLYSKSRRKAPIYWPLSTASGSYTLWIYYPSLTSQTLFTAVNDFLDGPNGKLTQVSRECAELRQKGSSRSSEDEKRYEMLQTFEQELTDFRDTLLKIAPTYQPHHDDGVQITAAPLWALFRHKPWQKVLKDTWVKLEKGEYDWAHLAMNYWPERVREKCKTDKSLAIAHGLESLYVEPEVAPKKTRSKKNEGIKE